MKWRDVRASNVFLTRSDELFIEKINDVWVVLEVKPSDVHEGFVKIRYAYLHNLDEPTAISEFSVDPESPVDYDLLFDEVFT